MDRFNYYTMIMNAGSKIIEETYKAKSSLNFSHDFILMVSGAANVRCRIRNCQESRFWACDA